MNRTAQRLFTLAALSLPVAVAAPVKFEVATSSGNVNVVTVESETAVENFTGRTSKVRGTLTFDPQAKAGGGTVIIDGASIDTGIAARNGHMRGAQWLNFDQRPDVKFTATRVSSLGGDRYRVVGTLTMNGVTRPLTTEATVRYTPANDTTKAAGLKGNVLAVSTRFNIKLSDFGVKHRQIDAGRVSNDLALAVQFVASDQ
ncbi:YceI family protein [Deinococcus planocerae]|uniref:YceI family protein n=1 Tax=Deinococcus planocerae TaxID=1737569 RepID=UPI000C7F37E9|nr:YceI family protein [Deinococcus planocerae]